MIELTGITTDRIGSGSTLCQKIALYLHVCVFFQNFSSYHVITTETDSLLLLLLCILIQFLINIDQFMNKELYLQDWKATCIAFEQIEWFKYHKY